jgi:hypothetical protein
MRSSGSCKCLNCCEFFEPDARNRGRQRYCVKASCRKASKAASQRAWLGQPENQGHFRGSENVERVRAWRKDHPGYWKRSKRARGVALQETLNAQANDLQGEAKQDGVFALQDPFGTQSPVLVGLIAHLTGDALQEDIARTLRTLHSRGRAVMGIDVPRPDYAKTNH